MLVAAVIAQAGWYLNVHIAAWVKHAFLSSVSWLERRVLFLLLDLTVICSADSIAIFAG